MFRKSVASTLRMINAITLFLFITFSTATSFAEDQSTATVGMSARIEQVVLPGSELKVKGIKENDPIVLRIISTHPHGPDMLRYDLEYYGLKPGEFNLVDFLERVDRTSMGEVPDVTVQIQSILAADRVEPNSPAVSTIPGVEGYQFWQKVVVAFWVIGMVVILFARLKRPGDHQQESLQAPSLADRLQPMVEKAISGQLSKSQMAELEMMLVAFWRKRLCLEQTDVAKVAQELKQHEEAGPLLQQLEILLHRPASNDEVDIAQILKPYQNLPAEAMEKELASLA